MAPLFWDIPIYIYIYKYIYWHRETCRYTYDEVWARMNKCKPFLSCSRNRKNLVLFWVWDDGGLHLIQKLELCLSGSSLQSGCFSQEHSADLTRRPLRKLWPLSMVGAGPAWTNYIWLQHITMVSYRPIPTRSIPFHFMSFHCPRGTSKSHKKHRIT